MSKLKHGTRSDAHETAAAAPSGTGNTLSEAPGRGDEVTLPEQFGRYRIVRKLGEGGMGAVFLAEDTRLQNRRVAIKIPKLGSGDELQRFLREAGIAATLSHPNLCPVYDVDVIEGRHFMAMAYIDGPPLSRVLESKRQSPRAVASIARRIAFAVHEAHRHGIIHRDLKPANVMIDARKEPVVMDFGLARPTGPEGTQLTQSGTILGSPAYMAKEQVLGEVDRMGPHTDVYSLGVMLYEMLTGRMPFEGPTVASILAKILTEDPPAPSTMCAGLDPALEAICRKAMAREIADRYPNMAEFAAALAEWLKQSSSSEPELTVAGARRPDPPSNPTIVETPGSPRAALLPTLPDAGAAAPTARGFLAGRRQWFWAAGGLLIAGSAAALGLRPGAKEGARKDAATDGEASEEMSDRPDGVDDADGMDDADEAATKAANEAGVQPPQFPLRDVVLPRDAVSGKWKRDRRSLVAEEGKGPRARNCLALPVELPDNYRFTFNLFALKNEAHPVCIGLLVAGRPATVVIDRFGDYAGLELIDGKTVLDNETTRVGRMIRLRELNSLEVEVRANHVVVLVNETRIIDWTGDPARLSQPATWPEATSKRLPVGAFHMGIRLARAKLERL